MARKLYALEFRTEDGSWQPTLDVYANRQEADEDLDYFVARKLLDKDGFRVVEYTPETES